MLKGSGDRIITNMERPGHVQVPWMEGHHHEPKQDSIKFKDSVCVPEGYLFLEDPVARTTHVGPSTVSKRTLLVDTGLYKAHNPIQVTFRF